MVDVEDMQDDGLLTPSMPSPRVVLALWAMCVVEVSRSAWRKVRRA